MGRNTAGMKRGFNYDKANSQLNIMVDGTSIMKLGSAAIASDGRAVKYAVSQATPALGDGYGVFETDYSVTGTTTGELNVRSTWINIGSSAVLGGYVHVHTDGIWDGGGTLTNANMAWGKFSCLLSSNPAAMNLWELNFSGANSEIDAIFAVNNVELALGYLAGTPTKAAVGSIPFCETAGGAHSGLRYIYLYDAADSD